MFETGFEEMLSAYADAVPNRSRFVGLVKDYFPGKPMQTNLIINAYDLGIADDIQKLPQINNNFGYRYVKRLIDEYGVSRINADWTVSLWCVCYGKNILGKPCEIKLSSKGGTHLPSIKEEKAGVVTYGDLFTYVRSSTGTGLSVSGFKGGSKKIIIFQNSSGGRPVTEVQDKAFSECEIEEAIFTEGFVKIGEGAFYGCNKLSQIVFPDSVKELGDYAFAGCKNLSLASLPPLLERIGAYGFSGTKLKNITIPKTVKIIGEGAFSGCIDMKKIELPESITILPDKVFSGCVNLTKVILSEKLLSIGTEAFEGCINLENIYVPESVKQIGENAFRQTHKKFILMCEFGSYAESYAIKNKLKYQLV